MGFNRGKYAIFAAGLVALLGGGSIDGCTGIKLTNQDGTIVHGRTLEFGLPVTLSSVVVPRNYSFKGTTTNGPGIAYTSKYAAVGVFAFDEPSLLDGLNEKGLAVGTFYFPGYAQYTPTTAENQSKSLAPTEFPNWVVTQFATVDEVKAALPGVFISPYVVKSWGDQPAPFHYIVYDKSGKCLVVEPVEGKLAVHETTLGTLTNSPTFDWHMTNLRNFINLSPYNVNSITIGGTVLTQFGQGSGMVGLPGDFTPPSRFVRASYLAVAATPAKNSEEGVPLAFHVLNNFDIPPGASREKNGSSYVSDITQITCVRDPQALKYYYKTFEDQTIKMVDLSKFDFDAKAIKKMVVGGKQTVVDVTADLK